MTRLLRYSTILALLTSASALASGRSSIRLPLAAGIAHPGANTALLQNPAGLLEGFKLTGTVLGYTQNSLNAPGLGAGITTAPASGSGLGAGALLTSVEGLHSLQLGAALGSSSVRAGIAVNMPLRSGGTLSVSRYGAQYFPSSGWSVGLELLPDFKNVGIGMSTHAAGFATLSVDGSINTSTQAIAVKPGLGFELGSAELALAYGIEAKGGSAFFGSGLSGGIGLPVSGRTRVEFLYEEFAKYWLSLNIAL